ncbi:MAG TPA: Asp-tRNA(Asn)/Glu-tRNA(Gln) amidotransferase subunit GatC [Methylomirabilota bacterium]|nr:Asp-tRNA(Asn)/Glu-tRNA(Gln) amidotransferase subunit GatC [Methylomirabilota bacterium]
MKLSREEVQHIALLARLRLTPAEEATFTAQLDRILAYMEKLNELETANVLPFSQAVDGANALREDAVTNRPDPEGLLANAPERDGTFFKVPKIIE